jgi:hypothetical protein
MVVGWAGRSLFRCPLLLGAYMSVAVWRLNNVKHFIKNVVSNTIFMIKTKLRGL